VSRDRFFDTNILVYAHTTGDYRSDIARSLLLDGGVIGVQALNEFASVARVKLGFDWAQIQSAVGSILILCRIQGPGCRYPPACPGNKWEIWVSIWDGLIVLRLSTRGVLCFERRYAAWAVVDGVRIENPFLRPMAT